MIPRSVNTPAVEDLRSAFLGSAGPATGSSTRQLIAAQLIGGHDQQEDAFAILDLGNPDAEKLVLIIADGMSGHARAANAAQLAVKRFCENLKTNAGPLQPGLEQALRYANDEIAAAGLHDRSFKGAGCTLIAAAIEETALSWISVGDSALYLFRHGTVRLLNTRHRKVVEGGTWARPHKLQVLRSSLTGSEPDLIDRCVQPIPLAAGDCIILASDGLDSASPQKIGSVLRRYASRNPAEILDHLLRPVRSRPIASQDNTTIIFYRVPQRGIAIDGPKNLPKHNSKWNLPIIAACATLILAGLARWLLG